MSEIGINSNANYPNLKTIQGDKGIENKSQLEHDEQTKVLQQDSKINQVFPEKIKDSQLSGRVNLIKDRMAQGADASKFASLKSSLSAGQNATVKNESPQP